MADGGQVGGERWYSAAELAGLPGLPATERRVRERALREGWTSRPRAGRGGGSEFAASSLPPDTQVAILLRHSPAADVVRDEPTSSSWSDARRAAAWARHDAASTAIKARAARAVRALQAVEAACRGGLTLMQARATVAAQLQREGVRGGSVANLGRWAAQVANVPPCDWLAALTPDYAGRSATATYDEAVWDFYRGHYLSREAPSHADAYERTEEVARNQGWTMPSARTLIRRMDRDVSRVTQVLLREGPLAVNRLLPAQPRDESVFGAGEAVNGDGLKFDTLWVKFDDGEVINTATAWFWQCISTRKVLAWRLAKTENTDLFRLATYDLTGICAPAHAYMDNTRVAANKVMTAGGAGRNRFRDCEDDGLGLLRMLGIQPHFTKADKKLGSPGAKPVERAFGKGGIHERVRTNPRLAGRGFSKATAISEHELRTVIAEEVAKHNAKPKRHTRACRGVLSFDQAWEAAVTERPPRVLTDSQRRLLLMSREVVTLDRRSGYITLKAGRGPHGANRYWTEACAEFAGRKLAVHFDPDNLAAGVHAYSLQGAYLFFAPHLPATAFNSTTAAREHGKLRKRVAKAFEQVAAAEAGMAQLERQALYAAAQPQPEERPAAAGMRRRSDNVVEANFQRVPDPARDAPRARAAAQGRRTHEGPSALDLAMFEQVKRMRDEAL